MNIESTFDALVESLRLAISAETEEQLTSVMELAETFASGLSEFEIERAKKMAIQ